MCFSVWRYTPLTSPPLSLLHPFHFCTPGPLLHSQRQQQSECYTNDYFGLRSSLPAIRGGLCSTNDTLQAANGGISSTPLACIYWMFMFSCRVMPFSAMMGRFVHGSRSMILVGRNEELYRLRAWYIIWHWVVQTVSAAVQLFNPKRLLYSNYTLSPKLLTRLNPKPKIPIRKP